MHDSEVFQLFFTENIFLNISQNTVIFFGKTVKTNLYQFRHQNFIPWSERIYFKIKFKVRLHQKIFAKITIPKLTVIFHFKTLNLYKSCAPLCPKIFNKKLKNSAKNCISIITIIMFWMSWLSQILNLI